jgi:hypothetical protein
MMKHFLVVTTCAILAGFSVPAPAAINADGKGTFVGAATPGAISPGTFRVARHGADNPPGDDRGGATNRGGKGRGGHDDGRNHA